MTGHRTERVSPRPEAQAGTFMWIGTPPPPPHTLQSGQEGPGRPGLTESPQRRRGGAGGASPTEMVGEVTRREQIGTEARTADP